MKGTVFAGIMPFTDQSTKTSFRVRWFLPSNNVKLQNCAVIFNVPAAFNGPFLSVIHVAIRYNQTCPSHEKFSHFE